MPNPLLAGARRIGRLYHRLYSHGYAYSVHDRSRVEGREAEKFALVGIEREAAVRRLGEVLGAQGKRPYSPDVDSVHWLLAAGLSVRPSAPTRILEIGTYTGEFTALLARLFPEARISTIDLPDDHPAMRATYNRSGEGAFRAFSRERARNLGGGNIDFVKRSSFHLAKESADTFDLAWVDGWHLYPGVAWDLCNAYRLLTSGGVLMCDDVVMGKDRRQVGYVSTDSFEVLRYLEEETGCPVTYFLKRTDPLRYASRLTRKYVAYWVKP